MSADTDSTEFWLLYWSVLEWTLLKGSRSYRQIIGHSVAVLSKVCILNFGIGVHQKGELLRDEDWVVLWIR